MNKKVKAYRSINLIVNNYGKDQYGNDQIELIKYKEPFSIPINREDDEVDRSRNFRHIEDLLIPVKEGKNLEDLNENILDSSKRALERFFGFAFANEWLYFGTFTYSLELVNRYDRQAVMYAWKTFRERLQSYDPVIKILAVVEYHEDGAVHLHSLIHTDYPLPIVEYGDITTLPQRYSNTGKSYGFNTFTEKGTYTSLPGTDYKNYFVPYYEFGNLKKSKTSEYLFSYNKYTFGINSFVILPVDEENICAVNYLSKYMKKSETSRYNEKRYFHTGNLDYKEKTVLFAENEEVFEMIKKYGAALYKSKEGFYVFRNFNIKNNTEGEE